MATLKKIRILLAIFIVGLALSGITAFPIETQLKVLAGFMSADTYLGGWLHRCLEGVQYINIHYPFLSYGTDWLAFAHLVIAMVFIGPYIDPVRNIWVIQFGMMACIAVIPLAMIAGPIRGIPFFWRLIDCSFGVLGIIPLFWIYRLTRKMEREA